MLLLLLLFVTAGICVELRSKSTTRDGSFSVRVPKTRNGAVDGLTDWRSFVRRSVCLWPRADTRHSFSSDLPDIIICLSHRATQSQPTRGRAQARHQIRKQLRAFFPQREGRHPSPQSVSQISSFAFPSFMARPMIIHRSTR